MTCTTVTRVTDNNSRDGGYRLDAPLQHLLAPADVAGLRLQTRFVMAPMTRFRSPGGVPTEEVAAYYRRRAAAGVGLIISEGIHLDLPTAGDHASVPRLAEWSRDGWRHVVQQVHEAGGKIFAQLWHLGSERRSVDDLAAWSPSGISTHGPAQAMTLADIDTVVEAFAAAGQVAEDVGFDGIEIHGAHGYLVDEFLWSDTNRRNDRYGGSASNRARLAAEIVGAIRDTTDPGFPIAIRLSQFKERDYGARIADTPEELAEVLEPIVQAGANLVHASQRRFWEAAFPESDLNLAGWTRRLTGLPSITVGSVGLTRAALMDQGKPWSVSAAAARSLSGEFDLVAVGRALLTNPDLIELLATGNHDQMTDHRKNHEDVYF